MLSPKQISDRLRQIAAAIDASRQPDRLKVIAAIKSTVATLEDVEPTREDAEESDETDSSC